MKSYSKSDKKALKAQVLDLFGFELSPYGLEQLAAKLYAAEAAAGRQRQRWTDFDWYHVTREFLKLPAAERRGVANPLPLERIFREILDDLRHAAGFIRDDQRAHAALLLAHVEGQFENLTAREAEVIMSDPSVRFFMEMAVKSGLMRRVKDIVHHKVMPRKHGKEWLA